MKQRLMVLNVLLALLLGTVAWRYRVTWLEARERENQILKVRVAPEKTVPLAPLAAYAPVTAAAYFDVAQKNLFAKDRNSNVIYDPPAPPAPPPPVPPMPVFFGLMTGFGDPGIILAEKPGMGQKIYRAGDVIGPFKLVQFDSTKVILDWDGQKLEKRLDQLIAKNTAPPAAAAPAAAAAAPAGMQPAPTTIASSPLGPGQDIGGGFRSCQANDSTPNGAVKDGLRKVEMATPFGKSCKWEPVR